MLTLRLRRLRVYRLIMPDVRRFDCAALALEVAKVLFFDIDWDFALAVIQQTMRKFHAALGVAGFGAMSTCPMPFISRPIGRRRRA